MINDEHLSSAIDVLILYYYYVIILIRIRSIHYRAMHDSKSLLYPVYMNINLRDDKENIEIISIYY